MEFVSFDRIMALTQTPSPPPKSQGEHAYNTYVFCQNITYLIAYKLVKEFRNEIKNTEYFNTDTFLSVRKLAKKYLKKILLKEEVNPDELVKNYYFGALIELMKKEEGSRSDYAEECPYTFKQIMEK